MNFKEETTSKLFTTVNPFRGESTKKSKRKKREESSDFDPAYVLPEAKLLTDASSHLYGIGLSHYAFNSTKPRNMFHNPLVILIVNLTLFIRCIVSLNLKEENCNPDIFMYIGDFAHFLKLRIHWNIAYLLYVSLALISQALHCWSFHTNSSRLWYKPFEMMSGSVSPQSIGITDELEIDKMIKRAKSIFLMTEFALNVSMPFAVFTECFLPYALNCTLQQTILYGIPWSLMLTLSAHYSTNFHLWQLVYFYFVCYYIRLKIKLLKNMLIFRIDCKLFNNSRVGNKQLVNYLIQNINSMSSEVVDFNRSYWSTYLFWVWATFLTIVITVIFQLLFGQMNIIIRIMRIYIMLKCINIFIFYTNSAATVAHEINKLYQILERFLYLNGKRVDICSRIKVCLKVNVNFYQNFISFIN